MFEECQVRNYQVDNSSSNTYTYVIHNQRAIDNPQNIEHFYSGKNIFQLLLKATFVKTLFIVYNMDFKTKAPV